MGIISKNITIIFLRAPEKGKVKTRLSKGLSDNLVLDLYKGFIKDIVKEVSAVSDILLYCHPPDKKDVISELFDNKYIIFPQKGDDIGQKMFNAFTETFENNFDKVVLIGTDIPEIKSNIIEQSFNMLDQYDSVIGPSEDGGYYLIGFGKDTLEQSAFENIDWSTSSVFEETSEIIKSKNKSYFLLPKLNDIDTIDDLKDLIKNRDRVGGTTKNNLIKIKDHIK
ncbi:MAG: glycosyltransferase [Desulfobacterales bacterium]|nr:glycosyltransferase [Desulfobacterales bacterium]MCP4159816.1 glycosyltransferase [Deltaproteobacteria bacterium]